MARQIPLTCSGHTRPVVHLSFSDITPYGYFLISACKGKILISYIFLRHFLSFSVVETSSVKRLNNYDWFSALTAILFVEKYSAIL